MSSRYILNMAEIQKSFFKVNWFRVDIWREWGQHLGESGKNHYADELELNEKQAAIVEKAGWLMWDVGDWLLAAELGGMKMSQMKKETAEIFPHRKWKTLRNWKVTSRAIESSRRRDGRQGREGLEHEQPVPVLSYSMHQQVEKFPPETQEELLRDAVNATYRYSHGWRTQPYSVGNFRALIKSRQKGWYRDLNTNAELAKPDPKTEMYTLGVRLKMTKYEYQCFIKLADVDHNGNVNKLFEGIVKKYVSTHKEEIQQKFEEHERRHAGSSLRRVKYPIPEEAAS
jgi:hypothetical protein